MTQRNGLFRDSPAASEAIEAYMGIAQRHGVSAAQLALAWCDQIDGVTSTIIGATTMEQLEEDISAFDIDFNEQMDAEVQAVLRRYPMPF